MRVMLLLALALLPASAGAQDIWATPETAQAPSARPPAVSDAQPAPPAPQAAPPVEPTRYETVALEAQTYEARVLLGLRQVVLRDFDGAIATLRRAAQLEPGSPAAFCHLGDAQLEKGDLSEARAAYESCARFASMSAQARFTSLAFVGLARVVERTPQAELRDKRESWLRARDGAPDAPTRSLAEARLSVYDAALARESSYEGVRRRIVAREVAREAQAEAVSDPESGL